MPEHIKETRLRGGYVDTEQACHISRVNTGLRVDSVHFPDSLFKGINPLTPKLA
jgi:hypothetical protein